MSISDCSSDVFSSDLGQPRLQAARGAARRAAAALRRDRRHLRLCHHRAAGGAAAGRQDGDAQRRAGDRSEEHTSELQSLMRTSYAVFCLKKNNTKYNNKTPQVMITTQQHTITQNP